MKPQNPYDTGVNKHDYTPQFYCYQAWAECFTNVIKWLSEPCTEHPKMEVRAALTGKYQRKDCPECWKEVQRC